MLEELKPGDLFLIAPEHAGTSVLMRLDTEGLSSGDIPCITLTDGVCRRYTLDTLVYPVEGTLSYRLAER
jgi:hypothetical protein